MKKLLLVTLISPLIAYISCGDDDASTPTVAGNLQIASAISITSATNMDMTARTGHFMATASTDLPASDGHYSFAKVDGIKVTINEVRGAAATSNEPLVVQTVGKEIELTDDPNAAIALTQSMSWAVGSYSGIDLRLANSWKVKAYCKTQLSGSNYTLVYTTASGVATQSCTTSSCTLPSTYDYYAYSFLDDYYTGTGTDPNIATHYNFSIAEGETPTVTLLFDATNTVACWSGSSWSSNEALGSFRGPSSDRRSALWPDGTGAFAVPVMPVLTYVSKTAGEAAPKVRTFFTSDVQADLNDPIKFENTETVSLIYNSAGNPVAGNSRNAAGYGSDYVIEMDFDVVATSTTGTGIDLYPSGWYWAGGTSIPQLIRNRKFEAFQLPATRYSVFSATYKDGDGCGQSISASKPCLGSGVTGTYYWREVVR